MNPLLRDRAFLRFFAASTVSELGDQVTLVALPLAAIVVLHASTLEVAMLTTAEMVPFLLFALPAGVWIDRMRRRPLMLAADAIRAASLLSIPVASWSGDLTLAQLYAVAIVSGSLTVVFDVSYLAFLPSLVGASRLRAAHQTLLGSRSTAMVAGPSVGGALAGLLGAPVALLADAASFGVSGVLIASLRQRREDVAPRAERRPLRTELADGIRYVLGEPYVRATTAAASGMTLAASGLYALTILYLVRGLHQSQTTVGWVFGVGNAGAIVGAIAAGRVARAIGAGRAIALAGTLGSAALLSLPLAPHSDPLPVVVAGGIVATTLHQIFNVNQLTLRQAVTPAHLLGRMNAVVRFAVWGMRPAGAALGGVLASTIGLRTTLIVECLGAMIAMASLVFTRLWSLERVPDAAAPELG